MNHYGYLAADPINSIGPSGNAGLYAGGTVDIAGVYGFSMSQGAYFGTGGYGDYSGAQEAIGFELGAELELGFYTGDRPPQAGEYFWSADVDLGPFGAQFNYGGPCDDFSLAITAGPGTPGITINSGVTNVSF